LLLIVYSLRWSLEMSSCPRDGRIRPTPRATLFPYTTLFRSQLDALAAETTGWVDSIAQDAESDAQRSTNIVIVMIVTALVFLGRSEEHTSELQSRENLVCRLLLEKKNYTQ